MDNRIKTKNINGFAILVGNKSSLNISISQESRSEVFDLLEKLHFEIKNANIPESTKKKLLNKILPKMKTPNSKELESKIKRGIERINDIFESIGTVSENISGILATITKIAKFFGFDLKKIAPFIFCLLKG